MFDIKIEKYDVFVDKLATVQRRIEHLSNFQPSPSLLRYKEAWLSPRHLVVTAEPPDEGLLVPLKVPMGEEEACTVLGELLLALCELHGRNLVHGHLRIGVLRRHNISGRIVILEHVLPIDLFDPCSDTGGRVWRCCAPEIEEASSFDYSADVWALGAVFLQLVSPAGKTYETADLMELDIISPEVSSLSSPAISFLMQCLQRDAWARPTIAELLAHPLFSKDRFDGSGTDENGEGEEGDDESEGEEESRDSVEESDAKGEEDAEEEESDEEDQVSSQKQDIARCDPHVA